MVLDNTTEYLRGKLFTIFNSNQKFANVSFQIDPDDPLRVTEDSRQLGLVVCRGNTVVAVCPCDGMDSIPNPFIQQE